MKNKGGVSRHRGHPLKIRPTDVTDGVLRYDRDSSCARVRRSSSGALPDSAVATGARNITCTRTSFRSVRNGSVVINADRGSSARFCYCLRPLSPSDDRLTPSSSASRFCSSVITLKTGAELNLQNFSADSGFEIAPHSHRMAHSRRPTVVTYPD